MCAKKTARKILKNSSLLTMIFLLSNCGDPSIARKQSVTIITPGVSKARCNITGSHGLRASVAETPNTVFLTAGHGPLTIICKKEGYADTVHHVKEIVPKVGDTGNFVENVQALVFDPFATVGTRYPNEIEVYMLAE
jgi:hypothetical protein